MKTHLQVPAQYLLIFLGYYLIINAEVSSCLLHPNVIEFKMYSYNKLRLHCKSIDVYCRSCELTDTPTMMAQIYDDHDRIFETLGKSGYTEGALAVSWAHYCACWFSENLVYNHSDKKVCRKKGRRS